MSCNYCSLIYCCVATVDGGIKNSSEVSSNSSTRSAVMSPSAALMQTFKGISRQSRQHDDEIETTSPISYIRSAVMSPSATFAQNFNGILRQNETESEGSSTYSEADDSSTYSEADHFSLSSEDIEPNNENGFPARHFARVVANQDSSTCSEEGRESDSVRPIEVASSIFAELSFGATTKKTAPSVAAAPAPAPLPATAAESNQDRIAKSAAAPLFDEATTSPSSNDISEDVAQQEESGVEESLRAQLRAVEKIEGDALQYEGEASHIEHHLVELQNRNGTLQQNVTNMNELEVRMSKLIVEKSIRAQGIQRMSSELKQRKVTADQRKEAAKKSVETKIQQAKLVTNKNERLAVIGEEQHRRTTALQKIGDATQKDIEALLRENERSVILAPPVNSTNVLPYYAPRLAIQHEEGIASPPHRPLSDAPPLLLCADPNAPPVGALDAQKSPLQTARRIRANAHSILALASTSESQFMSSVSETPGTIVDVVTKDDELTMLADLLTNFDTLSSPGEYTILAPTDDAFYDAFGGDSPPPKICAIVKYHCIRGIDSSTNMTDGLELTTIQGGTIRFKGDENTMTVAGSSNQKVANIVKTGIPASNGVIHKIDSLICSQNLLEELGLRNEGCETPSMSSNIESTESKEFEGDEVTMTIAGSSDEKWLRNEGCETPSMSSNIESTESKELEGDEVTMTIAGSSDEKRLRNEGCETPSMSSNIESTESKELEGKEVTMAIAGSSDEKRLRNEGCEAPSMSSNIEPTESTETPNHYHFHHGNSTGKKFYEVLDITRSADADGIKVAYHNQCLIWHPDKNKDSVESKDRFVQIKEAYETLNNPVSRDSYDRYCSCIEEKLKKRNPKDMNAYRGRQQESGIPTLASKSIIFNAKFNYEVKRDCIKSELKVLASTINQMNNSDPALVELKKKAEWLGQKVMVNEEAFECVNEIEEHYSQLEGLRGKKSIAKKHLEIARLGATSERKRSASFKPFESVVPKDTKPEDTFSVTVPEDIQPEDEFEINVRDRDIKIQCPVDCGPGSSLLITASNNRPTTVKKSLKRQKNNEVQDRLNKVRKSLEIDFETVPGSFCRTRSRTRSRTQSLANEEKNM